MLEPTPEAWALIRHAYEHTDQPLAHICDAHEITIPMLRYRMKKWDWTRRKPLVPRQGPDKVEAPADSVLHPPLLHPTPPVFAPAPAGDPPPQEPAPGRAQARPGWESKEEEPAAIVPRLRSAVARVLPAIEATVARLAATQHPREMEQAGRTLGALTRALRELTALLDQHKAEAGADERPSPEEIDEFRQELSRRLRGIIEARKAAILEKT